MSENNTNTAPMRLRAEAPRVTRLSRKVLASVTAVGLVGIGGALIYASRPAMEARAERSSIRPTTDRPQTVLPVCRATTPDLSSARHCPAISGGRS